jgi:hypothetical protein
VRDLKKIYLKFRVNCLLSREGKLYVVDVVNFEPLSPMKADFLGNFGEMPRIPVPAPTPGETNPSREPLKHLLIGSPQVVTNAIHGFYALGYAEVSAWSPLLPTANAGEVMSILIKYVTRN